MKNRKIQEEGDHGLEELSIEEEIAVENMNQKIENKDINSHAILENDGFNIGFQMPVMSLVPT